MKKTVLKLSAASFTALHCINTYIDRSAINTKSRGKYYSWKYGDISYMTAGKGEPVLLIHDLSVFSSGNDWNHIIKNMSETNKVYVLDLLGCGRSDKPALTYTNYLYVQLVTDFVKDVIQKKPFVVTSGLSATFVLKAFSMDQNLFQKICLINPPSICSSKYKNNRNSEILTKLFSLPIIGRTCFYIATNKENTELYLTEKAFFNPFHVNSSFM